MDKNTPRSLEVQKALTKELRKHIDACIEEAKSLQPNIQGSRALSISITKLEEAKMWGGKRLEELNPDDYPVELRDKAE